MKILIWDTKGEKLGGSHNLKITVFIFLHICVPTCLYMHHKRASDIGD